MKLSEILKRAFLPRICILCGDVIDYDREAPFCDDCMPEWLANLDLLCSRCGYDCDYCTCLPEKVREINNSIATFGVFYIPGYMTPANRVVYKLKRKYVKEVIWLCAGIMHKKALKLCLKNNINFKNFIVTYPTRRKSAIIKYGHDHARLLAKDFARRMGLALVPCFDNIGEKEQKTLSKSDRMRNAMDSYDIKDGIDIKGKSIFLIDDVMTSGATLSICAKILLENGAKQVIPVTFAKDTIPNTTNFVE